MSIALVHCCMAMALVYLLVIELIVRTQPDHHAEAVPPVHHITLDSIACRSAR